MKTPTSPVGSDPAAGFTLLELLMVLAIIGLTVSLVTARLTDGKGRDLEVKTRMLRAELIHSRRQAIISGRPRIFTIDQTASITFFPGGGSTGGVLTLTGADGRTARLQISPLNGAVTIQRGGK